MEGRVTKSTGSWYSVFGQDGKTYQARLQGKLRLDESKESNPVTVGDRVVLLVDEADASIIEIIARENHILRQSVKKTGHSQALAANVDQVMLIATLRQPRTSLGFIDRFLVSAESFRIPQVLIFNKKDLLDADDMAHVGELQAMYTSIGVTTFIISAHLQTDADRVKDLLHNKTTLVAGHSGAGKSTLLNLLAPEIKQTVGEVSDFSNKGTHTTTFTEMFMIAASSFVIDTPGVKEWGLVEMGQQEISDYFPEMRELRTECKFGSRCLHLTEPKCSIRLAVEEDRISLSRYNSYVSMVMGEDNRK